MSYRENLSDCPYLNSPPEIAGLVEIADTHGRPLLLMPLASAERRKLPRRIVLICLRDGRGRFFLSRRAAPHSPHPGLWDLSVSGSVMAGESFQSAALRELAQKLGIRSANVRTAAFLPYIGSDGASLSAMFFMAGPAFLPSRPRLDPARDGMFVDADELRWLAEYQQNMLTPELVWVIRSGRLFPPSSDRDALPVPGAQSDGMDDGRPSP